jgi:metal-responsive CopG/Arc/MetJ family transcriptional regulator
MVRIVVSLKEEMHEALKEIAKKKSNSVSGITRLALYDLLKENGYTVEDWYIEWGGSRKKDD